MPGTTNKQVNPCGDRMIILCDKADQIVRYSIFATFVSGCGWMWLDVVECG